MLLCVTLLIYEMKDFKGILLVNSEALTWKVQEQCEGAATSLPYKRTGHESNESHSRTHDSCPPATKDVCEDAHYGAAEEDHAHGQRAYPRWRRGESITRLQGCKLSLEGG